MTLNSSPVVTLGLTEPTGSKVRRSEVVFLKADDSKEMS